MNARKHGLRAESDIVAPDEAEAVAARREEWADAFPGGGGKQGWIADQLVLASVRIDRCQEHQRHQAAYEADRAGSSWEADREADAARLGARLGKESDRVVSALRRSAAGIDWLLSRWRGLADRLEAGGPWDDPQRQLCLDLLRTPDAFRDAEAARLAALSGEALRELARAQIDHLEALRGPASRFDDVARQFAALGMPMDEPPDLRRLRRYETALWRRFRSLEASWHAEGSPAPVADDDSDAAPLPEPPRTPALAPPPAPTPPPGPPGPRPDRSALRAARNAPPADSSPLPPRVDPTPASPIPATPADSTGNSPSTPPVLLNRRQRRAALKRAKQRS